MQLCCPEPGIPDQLKSGMGGVDAVIGPIGGRSPRERPIKNALQRNEGRVEIAGNGRDSFLDRPERSGHLFRHGARLQEERLDQEKADTRILCEQLIQKAAVEFQKPDIRDIRLAVVSVVDPDEQGEEIGLNVQRVCLPALRQMLDGLAADSTIDELEPAIRILRPEVRGDEKGVSVTELVGGIDFLWLAEGVGDRVTLEEDFHGF